jgi:hypothetical protein
MPRKVPFWRGVQKAVLAAYVFHEGIVALLAFTFDEQRM